MPTNTRSHASRLLFSPRPKTGRWFWALVWSSLWVLSAGCSDEQPAPDTSSADVASDTDQLQSDIGDSLADTDVSVDLGPRPTFDSCYFNRLGELVPEYDQFEPAVGYHCLGTDHQDISDIERVVFLGDSVTAGTPPTHPAEFYRAQLETRFGELWPGVEVANCSEFGARTDDFLGGQDQVANCFPDERDDRRTLVIFTIGGNDQLRWAQDELAVDDALIVASEAAALLEDTIRWFVEPSRFPSGVFIIYATPFEYTDATGDLGVCDLSEIVEVPDSWIDGAPAILHFAERYMEIAVEYQVDLVFSLEEFCGHGLHHDNPESQCYLGEDSEQWFDFTCIHPNPTGHTVLADMFMAVVGE